MLMLSLGDGSSAAIKSVPQVREEGVTTLSYHSVSRLGAHWGRGHHSPARQGKALSFLQVGNGQHGADTSF